MPEFLPCYVKILTAKEHRWFSDLGTGKGRRVEGVTYNHFLDLNIFIHY